LRDPRRPSAVRRLVCIAAITLAALSARAETFNIEIDYMVETGADPHSHRPTTAEVEAVVQMFACQGHTLNIVVDDQIPHYDVLLRDPVVNFIFFDYSFAPNSFGALKRDHFDHGGQPGWHYCIFAHQYQASDYTVTTSSGLAELGGDDFVVTLGAWSGETGTPFEKATTLAHEFGHNLGLTHCGDMDCSIVGDYTENLPSIMSYFYQIRGVRSNLACHGLTIEDGALFKEIDYSHGRMCTLYEPILDESFGTGMIDVDWNCDGTIGGIVAQDLDGDMAGWCGASGTMNQLSDFNEWAYINDGTNSKSAGELTNMETVSCITAEEVAEHEASRLHYCDQPTLATEACVSGRMIYLSPNGYPSGPGGWCDMPFSDLSWAHLNATSGSILFAEPGTYSLTSEVTLDRPMTLRSYGTANFE
jgi:hypothetical protein